jgi:outer membrane receptor protein involved in Fe transport
VERGGGRPDASHGHAARPGRGSTIVLLVVRAAAPRPGLRTASGGTAGRRPPPRARIDHRPAPGGGKAEQYLIRGFDADHGTDIALFVDGLPVNLRSHAHGQGYADLHFLIPETVRAVEVLKGPYFPEYGDFATAAVVSFVTKDFVEDNTLEIAGGSFNTQRYLALLSPTRDAVKTLRDA